MTDHVREFTCMGCGDTVVQFGICLPASNDQLLTTENVMRPSVLAKRVRERREQLGLTQAELANQVSEIRGNRVSQQSINDLEHEHVKRRPSFIAPLAVVLKTNPDWLLGTGSTPERAADFVQLCVTCLWLRDAVAPRLQKRVAAAAAQAVLEMAQRAPISDVVTFLQAVVEELEESIEQLQVEADKEEGR